MSEEAAFYHTTATQIGGRGSAGAIYEKKPNHYGRAVRLILLCFYAGQGLYTEEGLSFAAAEEFAFFFVGEQIGEAYLLFLLR